MTGPYDTLRARGNISGKAIRPDGADDFGPRAGTWVPWVLSQPVQDLVTQGRRRGWVNAGTIGNTAHLRLHGDHTPWSLGKASGVIYAKDTAVPDWVLARLKALCASDYDTTWIQFFNLRGGQYDNAGRYLGPSGDEHLHISVRRGQELRRVTLFDDLTVHPRPPLDTPKDTDMSDLFLVQQTGDNAVWLTNYFDRKLVADSKDLAVLVKRYGPVTTVGNIANYGSIRVLLP